MANPLQFGVIGLGRMGGGLALQALQKKMLVAGFDIRGATSPLVAAGLKPLTQLQEFALELSPPRKIFLYVPAGSLLDELLEQLTPHLSPGDIVVDGGNSYWGDSIRRNARLKEKAIYFVDLGTSGGVEGALHGACFMVGGEKEAVAQLEPILRALAVPEGYAHAGGPGSGHFTKLIHNGIEFGMLQAIGEGVDLLKHYPLESLNIPEILHCWNHGSVIRSWLVELMESAVKVQDALQNTPPYVEDTGEVNWLVEDALHLEVSIPVISQSVMQLLASRDSEKYWARAVALMRHGFGGHPFGPNEAVRLERTKGQIGGFYRPSSKSPSER